MTTFLPPQRPPSRSERLLRETLRRDGEVRESGLASPPRRPSLSRRHSSRVSSPTSSPSALPASASCGQLHPSRPSSPSLRCKYAELADEQYTRGAFLFRSAITNAPNSLLPAKMECMYAPAHPHVHGPNSSDGTVTPTRPVLNGNSPLSPNYHSRMSTRSTSPSPPPVINGGIGRRHSLQRPIYHEPRTPQEHALRAQLENYLEDKRQSSPMAKVNNNGCCDQTRSGSVSQPQFEFVPSTSPHYSSSSLNSGPSSYLQDPPTRTHVRSRSKTDPPPHTHSRSTSSRARTATYTAPTPATSSSSTTQYPSNMSPRRSAALTHTQQLSTQLQAARSRKHISIEATPPLTADASPTGISEGNELEPEDSRLITPPPSPPLHNNTNVVRKSPHQHTQPHSPSPYRPTGDWSPPTVNGNHHHHQQHHHHSNTRALHMPPNRPHTPSVHHASQQSQFNVRKASEQCKLIDGYVSFLSIEGLGGPPGADSPVVGNEEGLEDEENQNREKRMFGIGWNGLKRLLPLAVVGAMNSGNAGHETSPASSTSSRTSVVAT